MSPAGPTVEMLWESVDPAEAITSRFHMDAAQAGEWITTVVGDEWGIEVSSCERVVISAGNALFWLSTSDGGLIAKSSVFSWLFPRLGAVARLTTWLDERGLPVSKPIASRRGEGQVERDEFSLNLQAVIDGELLDAEDLTQVEAAGTALARLHLGLAEYPEVGEVGTWGQGESTPMRARLEAWLASPAAGADGIAPHAEVLRRRLDSLPGDEELSAPQLVHLDVRSANLIWRDGIAAILDFEEVGVDYPLWDLVRTAVLLGARFRDWRPVPTDVHDRLIAAYESLRPLSAAERQWLGALMLWRTLQVGSFGHQPEAWADSAGQLSALVQGRTS